nr:serine protease [uncultured Duganella sp.]
MSDDRGAASRHTIGRFLKSAARAGPGGKGATESFGGGTGKLAPDGLDRLVEQLQAAKRSDPLTFGDVEAEPDALRAHIATALDAVDASGENASLSPKQLSSLESIILLIGRPPILVLNDDFELPSGEWEILAPFRQDISRTLRSVGRLATGANQIGATYVGTGFMVGQGVIMTNRHVFEPYGLVVKRDGMWKIAPGITLRIDFKQEFGNSEKDEFNVVELLWLDERDDFDLALLRIEAADGRAPPPALALQSDPGYVSDGNMVYAVGYPAVDPKAAPKQVHAIFEGTYEKKRLSPGRIMHLGADGSSFSHDCTTLRGSSGSCIVDLPTNSVVGLHFAGDYLEANWAVQPGRAALDNWPSLNFVKGRHA